MLIAQFSDGSWLEYIRVDNVHVGNDNVTIDVNLGKSGRFKGAANVQGDGSAAASMYTVDVINPVTGAVLVYGESIPNIRIRSWKGSAGAGTLPVHLLVVMGP